MLMFKTKILLVSPASGDDCILLVQYGPTCRCGRETQLKETGLIVLDADLPARNYDCAAAHLHSFGSKRPSHPPGVKADHKHDIDRHAKDNVKHRHEQHSFLQHQCL